MIERPEPIPLDAGRGGDWIKQGTWDLHGIETAEALRSWLDAVGLPVERFKSLAVYRANVRRFAWLLDLSDRRAEPARELH